jgi:hypothetical protein
MQRRSHDDGRSIAAFMDRIDVVCPSCARRAIVTMSDAIVAPGMTALRGRFSCTQCGSSGAQRLPPRVLASYAVHKDGRDPMLGLPLWLVTQTRHGLLFAYNREHLGALETYVGATLRERHAMPPTFLRNRTMQSRLPRWMKLAVNRGEVLKALGRLRERDASST